MFSDEANEIDELIDKLESDEVQTKLLPGFQREFGTTAPLQWRKNRSLSPRQIEILRDIIQRYDSGSKRSSFQSRRYEGYDNKRHS